MATKINDANQIVKHYVAATMVAALIPIPVFDLIAITGIQLKLLHRLSRLYHVPYSANLGKSLIASLLGGVTSVRTGLLTASVTKSVPGLGTLSSITGVLVVGGASTYAIGKVFVQHFESGGTFLTFDPEAVRKHFMAEFERGKQVVEERKPESSETTGPTPVSTPQPAKDSSPKPEASAGTTPEPEILAGTTSGLEALAGTPPGEALAGTKASSSNSETLPAQTTDSNSSQPLVETPDISPEPTVPETAVPVSNVPQPLVETPEPSPEPTVPETVVPVSNVPQPLVETPEPSPEPTVPETAVPDSTVLQPSVEIQEPPFKSAVPETNAEVTLTSASPVVTPPPTTEFTESQERSFEPAVTETIETASKVRQSSVEPQESSAVPPVAKTTTETESASTIPQATSPATEADIATTISSVKAVFGEGPKSNPVQESEAQPVSLITETPEKTAEAVSITDTVAKHNVEPPAIIVTEDNNSSAVKKRTRNYGMGRMR